MREVTRDRWTSAMQSMSAQLDAIDAMARDMDADFKVEVLNKIDKNFDFNVASNIFKFFISFIDLQYKGLKVFC